MHPQQPADPVERLNDHHADDLLIIARTLGGHPDALSARAQRVDHSGIDLIVDSPRGQAATRVAFSEPLAATDDMGKVRVAFVRLARRARTIAEADPEESSDSGASLRP